MNQKSSKPGIWIVLGIVASVILVALVYTVFLPNDAGTTDSVAAAAPGETATQPSSTLAPANEIQQGTTVTAEPEPTPVAETPSKDLTEEGILTEDDRSDRLASLTSDWNTNWERHTIQYDEILSGGPPRDGIPSIDNPQFISPEEAEAWLAAVEPVIALEINGDARAYPIQILTWHEIANDVVGDVPVAVTFCPLCNSAITFDRRFQGETLEFGTSGLLRNSDLIMYDRTTESLWQQFTGEGVVGDLAGEELTFLPSRLISFADFQQAYPDGVVLSRETGFDRNYGRNPYVGYDDINSNPFLYNDPIDERLRPMARVVTVSLGDVDAAYPLDILSEVGVIHDRQGEQDLVVFHVPGTTSALDQGSIAGSRDVGATGVFDPTLDGQTLTFQREGTTFVDEQTGSVWNIVGQAIEGPLVGERLTPVISADHFWFSWAAFRPDTVVYTES